MSNPLSTNPTDHARVDAWLAAAVEDAERRGLPELKPLLQGLARATRGLRAADLSQPESTAADANRGRRS
jgi:hypothetical protein